MVTRRQIRLARRPVGAPSSDDFLAVEDRVPDLAEGEFLVQVHYVSVDPAMRAWISGEDTYRDPVDLGDLMPAGGVGQVTASTHPKFGVGTWVRGDFGVQDHAVSKGVGVTRIDVTAAPAAEWLGVLGISGLSAYFGLLAVGAARAGDTVLVSGAAGSVGSLAGQIAKIQGCRVIGVAGGAAKCDWLVRTLGFDAAIDYRSENVAARIAELCPKGVDVFFDNVGGDILEAGLANLALGARVVLCGAISQYNTAERRGPANYLELLVKRATMHGFLVFDHAAAFVEASARLAAWRAAGMLHGDTHVIEGLEAFPTALRGLFEGVNRGKLVLRLTREDT